jgi:ABC-type bacteriocin/lantibiotic exporter with double-glycine peptidase domain
LLDSLHDLKVDIVAPAQPAPGGKRLLVPWIGQNVDSVTTDDYTKSDCGAACVAMLINTFRGGQGVTVDEVSKATGLQAGYKFASFQELMNAAARFNVALEHVSPTLENIFADIDNGRPVIVIVNYKSLPLYNRSDPAYNAGHYIVVVGYEDDCILYHDPYWKEATRGAYRSMTREDFMRAYTSIAPGNSRAPHALRIVALGAIPPSVTHASVTRNEQMTI